MIANWIEPVEITRKRLILRRRLGLHFLIEDAITKRLSGIDFLVRFRQADGQVAGLNGFESLICQFSRRYSFVVGVYDKLSGRYDIPCLSYTILTRTAFLFLLVAFILSTDPHAVQLETIADKFVAEFTSNPLLEIFELLVLEFENMAVFHID